MARSIPTPDSVVLAEHGDCDANAEAILAGFSAQSQRLTAEQPYRLFKGILRTGFATAFKERGLSPRDDEIERLAHAPSTMGPHPDVPDALRRLRDRYTLPILTNSDEDLIGPTAFRTGVSFDYVITSQQARAYKPSRHLFEHAYREMDVAPEDTVHVAT